MASKWKERFLQASFRGVDFFITSHKYKSGRRLAEHTFPNVDDTHQEDMGRKKREIGFSAYIVNADYFDKRDKLVAALEKEGPGPLVHPYLGTMDVRVEGFEFTETSKEGRVVRFDISMVRIPEAALVSVVVNTASDIAAVKLAFELSLLAEFISKYAAIMGTVNGLVSAIVDYMDKAIDAVAGAKKLLGPIAEFKRLISTVKGKLIALALQGQDLGNEILRLVDFGNDPGDRDFPPTNPREQFDEMVALFEPSTDSSSLPPELKDAPDSPIKLISELFAAAAVLSAVGIISEIEFKTVEEANEVRDTLFAQLDVLNMNPTTSDDLIKAIQDTRRAVMADLDLRILDLTNQITVSLYEATPSIVIAHQVDGVLDYEEEIVKRNGVRHPGFVSPVDPVKVVFRG